MAVTRALALSLLTCGLFNSAAAPAQPAIGLDEIFVFGDSLSDGGRLNATSGSLPAPLTFAPSPPYFDGGFSDGPVWVDYLKARYPAVSISNLAVAGAMTGSLGQAPNLNTGTLDDIDNFNEVVLGQILSPVGAPVTFEGVIGLSEQINQFAGTANANAEFIVWAGANDFFAGRGVADVTGDTETALRALIGKGAMHLTVANLPDLGAVPLAGLLGAQGALSALTLGYNSVLEATIGQLQVEFPDVSFDLVDIYNLTNALLADPTALGITDVSGSCNADVVYIPATPGCSDPSTFFYYDPVHPTTQVHQAIADIFADSLGHVPEPATWLLIAGGVAAFRFSRRD